MQQSLSDFLEALFDPGNYMSWEGEVSLLNQVLDFAPTAHALRSSSDVAEGAKSQRVLDWTFFQVVEDDLVDAYEEVNLTSTDVFITQFVLIVFFLCHRSSSAREMITLVTNGEVSFL